LIKIPRALDTPTFLFELDNLKDKPTILKGRVRNFLAYFFSSLREKFLMVNFKTTTTTTTTLTTTTITRGEMWIVFERTVHVC
jgi:hypothetical protein